MDTISSFYIQTGKPNVVGLSGGKYLVPTVSTGDDEAPLKSLVKGLTSDLMVGKVYHLAEMQKCDDYDTSCLDLDFDIYQKSKNRNFTTTILTKLIDIIAGIVSDIFTEESLPLEYWVAVLYKNAPYPKEYIPQKGEAISAHRDGFHIRIFLKMNDVMKKYIIMKIIESEILPQIFDENSDILNPHKILDECCVSNAVLYYGATKRDVVEYNRLQHLYRVKSKSHLLVEDMELAEEVVPVKKGAAPHLKFKHFIVRELSVVVDGAYIKKPTPILKPEIKDAVNDLGKRWSSKRDINSVRKRVYQLTAINGEARLINNLLRALPDNYSYEYESWKKIMIFLGGNPEYRPLADWFSMQHPEKMKDDGTAEGLLNFGEEHISPDAILPILKKLVKENKPVEYQQIILNDGMHIMLSFISKYFTVNDDMYGEVLKNSFGTRIVSCQDMKSFVWYMLLTADDCRRYFPNTPWMKYKWAKFENDIWLHEPAKAYILRIYENIKEYISQKNNDLIAQNGEDCEEKKKNDKILATCNNKMVKIGNVSTMNSAIKSLVGKVLVSDFIRALDAESCDRYMGVANGVLRLRPKIELIDYLHDIPITRSIKYDYIPYNPDCKEVQEVESWINEWWYEKDVREFIMTYFASSLDSCYREPLIIFIVGNGSNCKSVSTDMHVNAMGLVEEGGYCFKGTVSWLRSHEMSGIDTEKMGMKGARFIYYAETHENMIVQMYKIKMILSENISGNDKYKKHETFKISPVIWLTSNHPPKIQGYDHGTWRRIRYYTPKMTYHDDIEIEDRFNKKKDVSIPNKIKDPRYLVAYLSILTKYYMRYRELGYNIMNLRSPTLEKETLTYRHSMDLIARFIHDKIISTDNDQDFIYSEEMLRQYQVWHQALAGGIISRIYADDFNKSVLEHKFYKKCESLNTTNYKFIGCKFNVVEDVSIFVDDNHM